jgi:3-hydroxybutyrate dehydrogenase
MKKKTILITGAGSGIGRGLAECAASNGYRVAVTDLDENAANQTAHAIQEAKGHADAFQVDVTCEDHVQQLIKSLVNVMLNGTCIMTRALLGSMRERGFGRIVNIGSIHSLVASPYKSAYVAAKHGLLGFSKAIALETADTDITINTICPSYVRTPLVDKQIANQAREHSISEDEVIGEIMLKPMPKGEFITIAELYGIVEFLASDSARNITGQTITVDGGWTIQ